MTPAARIEAAIALLGQIRAAPKAPADALASGFFRSRRYIGAADRRAISERVWQVLRSRRRLGWWLGASEPSSRLLVAASVLFSGASLAELERLLSGGRFAPAPLGEGERRTVAPLEGHTLAHPSMPEAV